MIDYPNSTKKRKMFLVLDTSSSSSSRSIPQGLTESAETVSLVKRESNGRQQRQRKSVKDRNWVLKKKDTLRRKGEAVPQDTKFTARKRRPKF